MKEKLKTKFLPPHYLQDNYTKLHNLRQESKSVEEYTREFEKLVMTCDLRENEDQTLVRYLGGLSESIRHVVELQHFSTLDEVSSLAHKVELQKKAKFKREPPKPPQSTYPTFNKESFPPPMPKPQPISTVTPLAKPNTTQPPLNQHEKRRCYKCQGFGHIASDCPNRRVITMLEYRELVEAEEVEEKDEKGVHLIELEEECVLEADEGELLVLRRDLSGLKGPMLDDQRERIFHTRCTINGRVCSLIVDGGSCTNVASTTLVEKLKLKTEPHPHPYHIQWINQGKGLCVSSRCLITLSIGKGYVDELWCDVLPMDAYHVLLGRPWQFDRRVIHDGFQNTYTLHKDGHKITLTPLPTYQVSKPKRRPKSKGGDTSFSPHAPLLLATHYESKTHKAMTPFTPSQEYQTKTPPHPLAPHHIQAYSHCFSKINDNVYKIKLPGNYGVSCHFNETDLGPHFIDDIRENLRANSLLEGEDDAHLGAFLDQRDDDFNKQAFKALSCDPRAVITLLNSPRAVEEAVVGSGWKPVFDPGKEQLC